MYALLEYVFVMTIIMGNGEAILSVVAQDSRYKTRAMTFLFVQV